MIDLPSSPQPRDVEFTLLDFGNTITPPLGGPEQRINRLGSRYAMKVTMPPMLNKEEGRLFVSRLARGKSEGVRMRLPRFGIDQVTSVENIGEPRVRIAALPDRTIRIKDLGLGGTPFTVLEGQMISIETAGTHYVYMLNQQKTTNPATGNLNLDVTPLLRTQHLVDDRVHFISPMIEGYVEGQDWQWSHALENTVGITFTIRERR